MTHLARASLAVAQNATAPSGNALRFTAAQRAIAAVMNGVDPERADVDTTEAVHISERFLHLSAAAALRQALMSRPSTAGAGRRRRRRGSIEQVTLDAYYLALALVADADGDSTALASTLSRDHHTWLPAAALVGRLQVRFLEQVCAQLEVTANYLAVPTDIASVPAAELFGRGAQISDAVRLLPNHAASAESADAAWLHATSLVAIEGRTATTVVDAGPSVLPTQWSARLAAPVTVTASRGRWPKAVVRDCLWMCEDAVRSWVGSMSRQLRGENNEDLLLGVGIPLRRFLVSPAARSIARVAAADPGDPGGAMLRFRPARAAGEPHMRGLNSRMRVDLLAAMRQVDDGAPLPEDTVIGGATDLAEIHNEELTLLSAVRPQMLPAPVEVTANLSVPDWEDVTEMVARLNAGQEVELAGPLLAWADRDIVSGDTARLTVRARVHCGIAVNSADGVGVFLGTGTRLSVLGADTSRAHCTLYLDQVRTPAPAVPAALPAQASNFCVA